MKRILSFLLMLLILFPVICFANNSKVDVVYFYSKNCLSCKANSGFIQELNSNKNVNLLTYDIEAETCQDTQLNYAKAYNVPEKDMLTIPMIYVGDKYFIVYGESERNSIRNSIDEYVSGTKEYSPIEVRADECSVDKTFSEIMSNISFWGILVAGLIDGINPCAISMLLLFYSFLMFCNQKKKIIIAASCFILGTFFANFTYGLGITMFYNLFSGNQLILTILYGFAILMCIVAIVVNSIDIYNQLTNKGDIKNQLPTSFKYKITEIARRSITSKFIFIGTFISGFLIGVIELACTGQIYYPTITYMMNNSDTKAYYFILLILYNIMFILPLIVVSFATTIVKDHEQLKAKIMKKNYLIKILANVFFLVMIVILINQLM